MILLVVEYSGGKVSKSTYELVTCAKQLGREGPVTALVLGSNVGAVAAEVAGAVDQVLVADRGELTQFDSELWSSAVAQIAKEGEASTVLIGGSRSGRDYSPRVAVKLDAALLEDVISVQGNADSLIAEHYTYLARVTEKVEAQGTVVLTVKPGAFAAATHGTEAAEQFDVDLDLPGPKNASDWQDRREDNACTSK